MWEQSKGTALWLLSEQWESGPVVIQCTECILYTTQSWRSWANKVSNSYLAETCLGLNDLGIFSHHSVVNSYQKPPVYQGKNIFPHYNLSYFPLHPSVFLFCSIFLWYFFFFKLSLSLFLFTIFSGYHSISG